MFKEKVKQCITNYQEELVKGLESQFNNFRDAADIDENDSRDADSHSHQAQSTFDEQRVSDQLARAKADLEKIKRISDEPTDRIEEGALIETKSLLIHVGIVTNKFTEDGKDIIGISTDAPIYKTLRGQSVGFPFQFAGIDCSILSIQ